MLSSGAYVDRRYRVVDLLGRGGMADVFRAVDTTTHRPVALKLLRGTDPTNARRFESEAEVLGRLDHPGLVRLCGTGTHDGVPYLVLDLVDGPSLAGELLEGPLGVERSLAVGVQLAEALAQAHRLGIVHRDIKPGNVLVDADGRVRLADFGIARLADAPGLTATGAVVGSAAYVAPEQLVGQVAGAAADVYALGLVLLECLTGRRCYTGTQSAAAALARLHRAPDVPSDLPQWLRELLRAMTARDPARRPSAAAVADVLRHRTVDALFPPTGANSIHDTGPTSPLPLAVDGITDEWGQPSAAGRAPGVARLVVTVLLLFAMLAVGWVAGSHDPATSAPATRATRSSSTVPAAARLATLAEDPSAPPVMASQPAQAGGPADQAEGSAGGGGGAQPSAEQPGNGQGTDGAGDGEDEVGDIGENNGENGSRGRRGGHGNDD